MLLQKLITTCAPMRLVASVNYNFRKLLIQPKLKMRTITPIDPPPGMNLVVPGNLKLIKMIRLGTPAIFTKNWRWML
jgi:hypothetical protein